MAALFALRDIAVGDELAFDYGDAGAGPATARSKRVCHCGAATCRGRLPLEVNL